MMNFSSFSRRLLKEAAWSGFGKIAAALGMLVGIRLLTETVPKEVYGTVSLLIGLITLGNNLFAAPLLQAAQRFHSEVALYDGVPQLRGTIVGMLKWTVGTIAFLILVVGGIYTHFTSLSFLIFLLLAAFLSLQVIRNLEISLFTAARRQKAVAIWSVSEAWLKPAIAVLIIVVFGASSFSILLGYSIATGAILLLFYLLPIRVEGMSGSNEPLHTDKNLVNGICRYALPLVPLALVAWTSSLSDRYIIGGILGIGQVGIYAAGYGLISMPFLIVEGIIGQTLRPAYFQSVSSKDRVIEKKILRTQIVTTLVICGLGVLAVCFLKNILAVLLLAEEYRKVGALLPWIAVGIGFQVISQIYEGVLLAYKKTLGLLIVHTVGAVISIISVFLLCSRFGLFGAAIACPVYYLSMLITGIALTSKLIK